MPGRPEYIDYRRRPPQFIRIAGKSDEQVWVTESFQAAEKTVYGPPIGVGDGPFTLTNAYKRKAKKFVEQRIAVAGARLAHLLNDELR